LHGPAVTLAPLVFLNHGVTSTSQCETLSGQSLSHLDRRYWISVNLDADVPSKEIKQLVSQSYELVCSKLTGKQKAELTRSAIAGARLVDTLHERRTALRVILV
jgi:hypothetical protein